MAGEESGEMTVGFLPLLGRMTTLRSRDRSILESISSFGVLSVGQLERLHFVSRQMTRRWLRTAELRGWVSRSAGIASGAGRPEDVVMLGEVGASRLGVRIGKYRNVSHQLMVSEFRLCVSKLEPVEVLAVSGFSEDLFVPDWVFGLRAEGKTLLFFLEADRGTEPLRGRGTSILGKLSAYTQYFQVDGYKVFEDTWSCSVRGFRVLFSCPDEKRAMAIHRVCGGHDFAWVTCSDWMSADGVGGYSWLSGDCTSRRSILGRLAGVEASS